MHDIRKHCEDLIPWTKFPSDEISMDEFSLGRDFRDEISVDKISMDEISEYALFCWLVIDIASLRKCYF